MLSIMLEYAGLAQTVLWCYVSIARTGHSLSHSCPGTYAGEADSNARNA